MIREAVRQAKDRGEDLCESRLVAILVQTLASLGLEWHCDAVRPYKHWVYQTRKELGLSGGAAEPPVQGYDT